MRPKSLAMGIPNAIASAWGCAAETTIEVVVSLQRQRGPVRYLACVAGRFVVKGVGRT